jgi:hypothetical protein
MMMMVTIDSGSGLEHRWHDDRVPTRGLARRTGWSLKAKDGISRTVFCEQ